MSLAGISFSMRRHSEQKERLVMIIGVRSYRHSGVTRLRFLYDQKRLVVLSAPLNGCFWASYIPLFLALCQTGRGSFCSCHRASDFSNQSSFHHPAAALTSPTSRRPLLLGFLSKMGVEKQLKQKLQSF